MSPPGAEHSEIAAILVELLRSVVVKERRGRVFTDGGVLIDREPDTVRAPDASLFLKERLSLTERITGYFEVAPNLVVEVKSPNDRSAQVHDKAIMWLNAGVDMVWVILPERREIDVYRAGLDVVTVTEPAPLGGLDVLPGFTCSLEEIFGPAPQAGEPAAR